MDIWIFYSIFILNVLIYAVEVLPLMCTYTSTILYTAHWISQRVSSSRHANRILLCLIWNNTRQIALYEYLHDPQRAPIIWHEPLLLALRLTHPPSAAYMRQWIGTALVKIMTCRLFGTEPLSKPTLIYCQFDNLEQASVKVESKYKTFHSWKCIWKRRLRNGDHFV